MERDWQMQNSPGDVKYNIGYIHNNAVITMYGVRWVLEYWDHRLVSYINV